MVTGISFGRTTEIQNPNRETEKKQAKDFVRILRQNPDVASDLAGYLLHTIKQDSYLTRLNGDTYQSNSAV